MNDTTLSWDNPLRFWKNLLWKQLLWEIKTINQKIEQNKAQYWLDKQTANISALSSENVSKSAFLTLEDVLPKKKSC